VAETVAALDAQLLQDVRTYLGTAKQLPYALSDDMVKRLQVVMLLTVCMGPWSWSWSHALVMVPCLKAGLLGAQPCAQRDDMVQQLMVSRYCPNIEACLAWFCGHAACLHCGLLCA